MENNIKNTLKEKINVHRWLVSNLLSYRFRCLLFFLSIILLAISEQMLKYIIKYLIDDFTNVLDIVPYFMSTLCMFSLVKIISEYTKTILSEILTNDISMQIVNKLHSLGMNYFVNKPTGELMSMFTTNRQAIKNIYERFYPSLISNYASIIIGIIFLSAINKIFVISLLSIYIPFGILLLSKELIIQDKINNHVRSKVLLDKKIYDIISSVIEIRFNGAVNWMKDSIQDQYNVFKKHRMDTIRSRYSRGVFYRIASVCEIIVNSIIALLLYFQNSITLGQFVITIIIVIDITFLLNGVLYLHTEQDKSLDYVKNVIDFLNISTISLEYGQNSILDYTIKLKNIFHSYDNKNNILKNINLEILPNEKLVIVGESGSGKSSLAKILSHLITPTHGEYIIGGKKIFDYSLSDIRNTIAYMFQETQLWNTSFKDNICLGKEYTEEEIINAAKQTGLHEIIMKTNDGYNSLIGTNGINLSGGEKQRLAITRIILRNPKIVILDESFCSLDSENEEKLREMFLKMSNKTIISIEHNLKQVQLFDKIVVLNNGNISEYGTYEELFNKKSLFYKMVKTYENNKITN